MTLFQLPQARLVPRRWLVLTTQELESQHCRHGPLGCPRRWRLLQLERRTRTPLQDA